MPERRLPAARGGRGLSGDIAGVGALNVDVVVQAPEQAVADSEAPVGAGEMHELLDAVASLPRSVRFGGSAFNTITEIARLRPHARLGFVGVAGQVPFGAPSFVDHLTDLGVDVAAVQDTKVCAGVCLAIEHAGNRALRIDPGANTSMAGYLDGHRAQLVAYLGRFRAVHVTSFLDEATPSALLRLIRDLRREAPGTRVVLDPGDTWCARPTEAVRGLLAAADVVLCNEREFAAVEAVRCDVVVKAPEGVRVRRAGARGWLCVRHEPLRDEEIRRPTGAGDAFAAGFLAAWRDDVREAAQAGLDVARAHLLRVTD